MKRPTAALLLVPFLLPLLAGCGDDSDDGATDGPAEPEAALVQTLVLTSAGGKVAQAVTYVDDEDAMKSYIKTFSDRDDVSDAIQQAVQDESDREGRLGVATVAVGCDSPEGVSVSETDDGWVVVAGKIANPKPECFAPVTTIAVVEIP